MYRILLVEDDAALADAITQVLTAWGHEVQKVRDFRHVTEEFAEWKPQIVLMDINMPVLDGYEATKEIRKYSAKVPIIAITAFAYASDEQRVMESGFDGYMPKPINARQLKAQLTDIMQKRIVLL